MHELFICLNDAGEQHIAGKRCAFQRGRAFLLYSGLHYDCITAAPFEDAPPDFHETRFDVGEQGVEAAFTQLVSNHHAAGQWTNTTTFTLRCTACHAGLVGEKEAREHAKETGHTGFSEFR